MSTRIAIPVLLFTLVAAVGARSEDFPAPPKPVAEHAWLKQFVGEWESESKMATAPGQPELTCKGSVKGRMLGEIWVVNEITGEMPGGAGPMNGLQTIGYDVDKKKYVGTWVDSVYNHLWKYTGTVDSSGKKLTLEAEGPNFVMPGKMAMFRDAYEFQSKDHILATSSMQGEDGQWTVFMTGHMHRKK